MSDIHNILYVHCNDDEPIEPRHKIEYTIQEIDMYVIVHFVGYYVQRLGILSGNDYFDSA